MRWFVEVSRVGETSIAEKYCVEAKQWQAALQEARKLRGDVGALSKFSIELLDQGYRAVDPQLKLRFLINEAPAESVLTEGKAETSVTSSGKPRTADSIAPATAFSSSIAPQSAANGVPRPGSLVPRPNSLPAPRANSVAPRAQQLLVPDDPVPPAPPLPPESLRPSLPPYQVVRQRGEEPRPEAPITYREVAYAVEPGVTRSQVEALLHDRYQATLATLDDRPAGKFVQLAVFDHVFQRRPERPPLATFAWKDWRGAPVLAFPGFGDAPMGPLSQVPPAPETVPPPNGVAPSVPPPASLSALPLPASLVPAVVPAAPPVPSFPAVASVPPQSSVPDSAPLKPVAPVVLSAPPPAPAVDAPAPLIEVELTSAPVASAEPMPVVAATPPEPAAAEPVFELKTAATEPVFELKHPSQPAPAVAVEAAPASEPAPAAEPAPAPALELAPIPAPAPVPSFDLNFESTPFNAAPKPERVSRPGVTTGKRRAGEDLIGELFEFMHDLHFMRDVAAGAEYVLSVIDEVLPCEGVLIHVFDINTSHFVVVRAKGPTASATLLQRMPDQDPFVLSVMRGSGSIAPPSPTGDLRYAGTRWQTAGVVPRELLCGPVKLGGRYLGLIELANPQGDAPFHASEKNALDYICEQFADFLSKKPIVLSADVVLARV